MTYRSLNQYFRETFGTKGYKISLSAHMTCPNRDGTLGERGCIFCTGADEFVSGKRSVTEQIDDAISLVEHKNQSGVYIAYFQDHTNTYADVSLLRLLFTEAISHPKVAVLSVATRPDCLPEEVLSLLEELNQIKPVWVELGLQTMHESTAKFIRRAYPTPVYAKAVEDLHRIGVQVITHLIIGLPGETREMLLQTVRYAVAQRTDGVKFHLLHILKGTDLYEEYKKERLRPFRFRNMRRC